jgi:MHS family proline/betaine transporter-like MFS transporter
MAWWVFYRTIFLLSLGNVVEWFEFIVYASLTPILSQVFFPQHDPFIAKLMTLSIFAIGFFIRPLGGMVFGYLADRSGRKKAFLYTFYLTALSALFTSLLPSYQQVGIWAPLALIGLRVIHGFAIGGDYPILVTYVYESVPPSLKGLCGSIVNVSTVSGSLIATLTVLCFNHFLSTESMLQWGWRLPFLIACLIAFISYFCRNKLVESPGFQKFIEGSDSLGQTLKAQSKDIIFIFLITVSAAVTFYTYNVFTTSYLGTVDLSYHDALLITVFSAITLIIFQPIAGFVSDRLGREKIAKLSLLAIIIFSYPLFFLHGQQVFLFSLMAQIIFGILFSFYLGPLPALISEQTASFSRCSIVALGYNLCIAIFGGTVPTIHLALIKLFDTNYAPAYYLIIAAMISFFTLIIKAEGSR